MTDDLYEHASVSASNRIDKMQDRNAALAECIRMVVAGGVNPDTIISRLTHHGDEFSDAFEATAWAEWMADATDHAYERGRESASDYEMHGACP